MKTATAPLPPLRSVKVLDQLRERIRYLYCSLRTEQAYVHWVRAFIRFHGVRHPATLGSSEVEAFLSWLANERKVSVSTHRQALAALLFFYGKVLCTDLPWLQEIGRHRPRHENLLERRFRGCAHLPGRFSRRSLIGRCGRHVVHSLDRREVDHHVLPDHPWPQRYP